MRRQKTVTVWLLAASIIVFVCLMCVLRKRHTPEHFAAGQLYDQGLYGQTDAGLLFDVLMDPSASDRIIRGSLLLNDRWNLAPGDKQFCIMHKGPSKTADNCCRWGNYGSLFKNDCEDCYDDKGTPAKNCPKRKTLYRRCKGCTYDDGKLSCWCLDDIATANWKTRTVPYFESFKLNNDEQVCVDKSKYNIDCKPKGDVSLNCTVNDKYGNKITDIKQYTVPRQCRNRGRLTYNGNPQPQTGDAFTCDAYAESCVDRGKTYAKKSWQADVGPCPQDTSDDGTTCTRYRFARRSSIPRQKPCDDGEDDDGTSCWLRGYGRGVGRVMKLKNGKLRCKEGLQETDGLCYPFCKPGYHNTGCCVCTPDGGDRITKTAMDRYECGNDQRIGALCYKPCPPTYRPSDDGLWCIPNTTDRNGKKWTDYPKVKTHEGVILNKFDRQSCQPNEKLVAGVCWENCNKGWRNDGAICSKLLMT